MDLLMGIVSLIAAVVSSFLLTRLSKPASLVDSTANFFTFFSSQIIAIGYLLSWGQSIHVLGFWLLLTMVFCLIVLVVVCLNPSFWSACLRRPLFVRLATIRSEAQLLSVFEKHLLSALLATVAVVGVMNFVVLVSTAPNTVDSMNYHLARMGYYLQQGHLGHYDANYWAQVVHPKNSTVLQLYTYLITARNENLIQLIQFIAYWVLVVVVFGVSQRLNFSSSGSLFAALVFALLIQCVMQSNTTQNDILTALYIALAVYSLLSFNATAERRYLFLAGVQLALALGTKMTAILALPSVFIVAIFVLRPRGQRRVQRAFAHCAAFCFAFAVGVGLFTLPSGYLENYLFFGHPLGPKNVRENQIVGPVGQGFADGLYELNTGAANLLRLGFDFLSVDGLPPIRSVNHIQRAFRAVPAKAMLLMGIDLEKTTHIVPHWTRFHYQRRPVASEDESFWGIFGFALIWPTVLVFLLALPKATECKVLALGAILFMVVLSYGLAYEPWHGRRTIIAASFAAPLVGWCWNWSEKKLLRYYLVVVVVLGSLSASGAVLLRHHRSMIPLIETSVFRMDRLQQLTRQQRQHYEALREFEELVPPYATVAVCLRNYRFEYPLFGKWLTRRLVPLNSFWRGRQPVPRDVGYLLYSDGYFDRKDGDVKLDKDWYLRASAY
jgi:hypothetical protein